MKGLSHKDMPWVVITFAIVLMFRSFLDLERLCNTLKSMTMELQYITDQKGHKNAVQLPMKDWEQIKKDLDELEH